MKIVTRMLHLAVCQLRQCQLINHTRMCISGAQVLKTFTTSTSTMQDANKELKENPFFEKYEAKIHHLKESSPVEYEAKLEELKKLGMKPSTEKQEEAADRTPEQVQEKNPFDVLNQPSPHKPKNLDDVLKLDLIKDKTRNEIEQIWKQYHSKRSGLFAVIEAEEYLAMFQKAQQCTLFVYPLPKSAGYEFILSQWSGHECHFTPLHSYQKHQENAPNCMSLIHYPELIQDKGIVLMAGEFDSDVLKAQEATVLAQQVQFYYGISRHPERFELVRLFNNSPENFNYMAVINQFEKLGLGVAS